MKHFIGGYLHGAPVPNGFQGEVYRHAYHDPIPFSDISETVVVKYEYYDRHNAIVPSVSNERLECYICRGMDDDMVGLCLLRFAQDYHKNRHG